MTGYYDIILGLIPASFVGLTALFLLAGLSTTVAVPLAAIPAFGLVGHAMFVRTPVSSPVSEARSVSTGRKPGAGRGGPRAE